MPKPQSNRSAGLQDLNLQHLSTGKNNSTGPNPLATQTTDHENEISAHPSSRASIPQSASSSQPRPKPRESVWWAKNKGVVLILTSEMFAALMSATTRLLETGNKHRGGMHPFQILFARMGITFLLSSIYMWYGQVPNAPLGIKEVRGLLVARGVAGFFGVCGLYFSLQYLALAEATVITFLAPILTAWACSLLFREPFARLDLIAGLVSFLGIIVIARPTSLVKKSPSPDSDDVLSEASKSSDIVLRLLKHSAINTTESPLPNEFVGFLHVTPAQRIAAVGIALIGVFGAACAYTTIRWIGKRAHPLISVNYYALLCTIISFFSLIFIPDIGFRSPATIREWGLLFFLGTSGFLLQFLLTAGLQHDKSSRATNMMYSQMLFALGLDKLIWGVVPDWPSIVGGSLILGSTIFVAVQKNTTKIRMSSASRNDEEHGLIEGLDREDGAVDGDSTPLDAASAK